MILGFDPGRDKCGLAVMSDGPHIHYAKVVPADQAIATVIDLIQTYDIATIVMGDQTTSNAWKQRLETQLSHLTDNMHQVGSIAVPPIPIVLVDERYSTLEARDRYWQLYPPNGLNRLVPQSLRTISHPIDDVVAIILIERYWQSMGHNAVT